MLRMVGLVSATFLVLLSGCSFQGLHNFKNVPQAETSTEWESRFRPWQ